MHRRKIVPDKMRLIDEIILVANNGAKVAAKIFSAIPEIGDLYASRIIMKMHLIP
jgi:hypothetical protein